MQKYTILSGQAPEPGQSRESVALYTEDGTPFNPLTPVINGWRKENVLVDIENPIVLENGSWVPLGKPIKIEETLGYIVQVGYMAVSIEEPPADFGAILFDENDEIVTAESPHAFEFNEGRWSSSPGDSSAAGGQLFTNEVTEYAASYQPAIRLHIDREASATIAGEADPSQISANEMSMTIAPLDEDEVTVQANLDSTFGEGVLTIVTFTVDHEGNTFELQLTSNDPDAASFFDENNSFYLQGSGNTTTELVKAQTAPTGPFTLAVVTAFFSITRPLPLID